MKKKWMIFAMLICAALLLCACGADQSGAGEQNGAGEQSSTVQGSGTGDQSVAGGSPNGLMEGASPATSALAMYRWDGETVSRAHLFNGVQDVLDELDAVNAVKDNNWTPKDVGFPVYGLQIGREDGWSIEVIWSNGYWIDDDGNAYQFDYDFEALWEMDGWDAADTFGSMTVLPAARHIACGADGWYSGNMSPAGELEPPKDVTMKLKEVTDSGVTATFTNKGEDDWMFGEYFSLQVELDGQWYQVPSVPGNWGFHDIGYMLSAGDKTTKTYGFAMYGDLPAGKYRLAVEGLTAVFQWKEDADPRPFGPLASASASSSLPVMYRFDGGQTQWQLMTGDRWTMVDELKTIAFSEAESLNVDQVKLPIYALELGATEPSGRIRGILTNGFWITDGGEVYAFDYDPEALWEQEGWTDRRELQGGASSVPCIRWLTEIDGGWNSRWMTPADEPVFPAGIEVELKNTEGNVHTVILRNTGAETWEFGEPFRLEVCVEQSWYHVPVEPVGNYGFTMPLYALRPGDEMEWSYHLGRYGDLPVGYTYRIVHEGVVVPFAIVD